ncbi:MAG TPA: LacI family DNA-binding transcriptional regulator [Arthrobacter sp.]|nr:LacI family DNA-binding transcriptional regulator [Arthrobacter sp.]
MPISTVSHVLNGTRHVNDETRQRVLKAIEETSYRQDACHVPCAAPGRTASAS